MRLRPLLFVIVLSLGLLGVAQSAPAQVAGEEQGVTMVRGSHGHVMRFSKRAAKVYRRIAGRRVIIGCSTVRKRAGNLSVEGGTSSRMRAPRKRHGISMLDASGADFCTVRLRAHRELVAWAPITADGRTFLDEFMTAALLDIPFLAAGGETDAPPPIALAVERGQGVVVALDGPDATPPARKVGYWTDGVRSVCAAVTAAGRRVFIEFERDVIRTNVLPYLTGFD
jgi:hypothetical protein